MTIGEILLNNFPEDIFAEQRNNAELELTQLLAAPKPNDPVGNLEGDLGSSQMQRTPKAQGHEADNLSEEANHG